jgi:predicted ATPase
MSLTIEELNDIRQNAHCAKFLNTNLHLHTPATPQDWNSRSNQTIKAEALTPEIYFDHLNKTCLDIVAITDHNTISWCDPLMRLASEGRRRSTSKLHVLPGIEITTYEGPHVIAIFPEDLGVLPDIQNLLTKLDLSGNGKPDDRVSKGETDQVTISKIIKMVTGMGGLLIGPHVHTKDGIWGGSAFRGREDILNDPHFRILAAPSGDIKVVVEHDRRRLLYKNMPSDKILNSFAFINISDCHRIDDFELNTTWIKVSEPTLEGIKQIIYEPELRVANHLTKTDRNVDFPLAFEFSEPFEITHPHIIGMAITGGMLGEQKISFSPHQNCIIGKNYAGKSSILDCLRFVTDDFSAKDEEAQNKLADRLRGILKEGGQVRAYVAKKGMIYGISRTLSTTKNKNNYKIEGEPEIYALIGTEFRRQSDMSIHIVCGLEAYAQGEVVKIKDNSDKQMTILDSLAKVDDLLRDVTFDNGDGISLLSKLTLNSNELLELDMSANRLSEETKGVENLQAEIGELERLANSSLLDEIKQWGEVQNRITSFLRQLNKFKQEIDKIKADISVSDKIIEERKVILTIENATREELDEYAYHIFEISIQYLSHSLPIFSLENSIAELEAIKLEIQTRRESAADQFKGDSDVDSAQAQLAERITDKKARLDFLLEEQTRLIQTRTKITELEVIRNKLLEEYNAKWNEIRTARSKIVEIINTNSTDNIQAELVESGDRSSYRTKLDEIASNLTSTSNKIASKQTQLDLVAENITPEQLIDIVKTSDTAKLVVNAGVTDNTARVLIGMGKYDLHSLEICRLHDKFVIKYRKEGDEIFTPIDSGLSGGEQALALLSVAMVPKEFPLLIDQPEDELGTALITKELVEQIRMVKKTRQLILVTHIANIPVLADSEYVIYVHQKISGSNKEIIVQHTGSLENKEIVARLLELDGGKYAFTKRNERYSVVINEAIN